MIVWKCTEQRFGGFQVDLKDLRKISFISGFSDYSCSCEVIVFISVVKWIQNVKNDQ